MENTDFNETNISGKALAEWKFRRYRDECDLAPTFLELAGVAVSRPV